MVIPSAEAAEPAPACNALLQLLNACPAAPTTTTTTAPGQTTTTACNAWLQLLNACPKPTTTTTAAPTTTTTAPDVGQCADLPKAGGGTWHCVWADEFDGTSLNRAKWLPQPTQGTGFSSNKQDCFMDSPNNVSVGGGNLTLTSRKEPAPFVCHDTSGDRTTQYTSGSVSTYGMFTPTYGRVEFRAKVISGKVQGTHTAFWLFPQDLNGGPGRGEIDVAEIYGIYSDRAIPYLHWAGSATDPNATNNYCMIPDIADWNTYVLEWTNTSIRIIYNGVVCLTNTYTANRAPWNRPYMLAVTQGLGWPGNDFQPGVTPLPASTVVDYVRVWQ
jgi:beta-glucanase (GH16 family)